MAHHPLAVVSQGMPYNYLARFGLVIGERIGDNRSAGWLNSALIDCFRRKERGRSALNSEADSRSRASCAGVSTRYSLQLVPFATCVSQLMFLINSAM